MTKRMRFIKILCILSVVPGIYASTASADERYRPVQNERVLGECGECHMAFQPQMLPKRSWERLMGGLGDHFGEDASIDPKTQKKIHEFLTANAADSSWFGGRFMRGLDSNSAPLRITETPHWIREHNEEVPESAWNRPNVSSKANCPACHRRAHLGDYDDD